MAARNKYESVFSESTLQSALPLITEDNYFDTIASADYNSTSMVEHYAKQWASSVSKRWVFTPLGPVTAKGTGPQGRTGSQGQSRRRGSSR